MKLLDWLAWAQAQNWLDQTSQRQAQRFRHLFNSGTERAGAQGSSEGPGLTWLATCTLVTLNLNPPAPALPNARGQQTKQSLQPWISGGENQ